jgi:hypothetical protein
MASNSRDLSHIRSLEDLQSEIKNMKAGLIVQEAQLQERRKHLPQAAKHYAIRKLLPTTIKKVVPFVLTRGAIARSFGFVRNAVGLISVFKKQKDKGVKNTVLNTVKKVGAAAAAKGIMNWIKNRKHNPPSSQKIEVS